MELSHWRVMLRTDEKLDFKSLPEGGRFSFDDYNTVAELRFTRELINKFNNDAERILSACFQYTNSFDEPWYDYTGDEYVKINSFMKPCRSSSVGDIFQNINENKYWMIAPLGFVRVYPPVDVYLEMARRRRKEKKDAESFEAPKTPKWKKIHYEDEEDGRYKPSVPAPTEDALNELLRSYEEGMEPHDVELSQYIVLEDKVVCFVGSYRESFYNHGTGEYTYKRKKHWFGLAYQTLIPYSKLTVEYLEARKNHEHWWEQRLKNFKRRGLNNRAEIRFYHITEKKETEFTERNLFNLGLFLKKICGELIQKIGKEVIENTIGILMDLTKRMQRKEFWNRDKNSFQQNPIG